MTSSRLPSPTSSDESEGAAVRLVPLRWVEGRYGSTYGAVGKIKSAVASVNYSTTRNDPQPYIVRVDLPGLTGERRSAKTRDEAKAIAAAMVNQWLRDAQGAQR